MIVKGTDWCSPEGKVYKAQFYRCVLNSIRAKRGLVSNIIHFTKYGLWFRKHDWIRRKLASLQVILLPPVNKSSKLLLKKLSYSIISNLFQIVLIPGWRLITFWSTSWTGPRFVAEAVQGLHPSASCFLPTNPTLIRTTGQIESVDKGKHYTTM